MTCRTSRKLLIGIHISFGLSLGERRIMFGKPERRLGAGRAENAWRIGVKHSVGFYCSAQAVLRRIILRITNYLSLLRKMRMRMENRQGWEVKRNRTKVCTALMPEARKILSWSLCRCATVLRRERKEKKGNIRSQYEGRKKKHYE